LILVDGVASGWAVSNENNGLLLRMVQQTAMDVNVLRQKTELILTRRLFFSHGQSQTAMRVSPD